MVFGHVERRNRDYVGKRMWSLELPDKSHRRRSRMRLIDILKEALRMIVLSRENAENEDKRKQISIYGNF